MNTIHYELYISVNYGNPNGDPHNGGRPRIDEEGKGLISPPNIKRKLRNVVPIIVESNPEKYDSKKYNVFLNMEDGLNKEEKIKKYNSHPMEHCWDSRLFGDLINLKDSKENAQYATAVSVGVGKSLEPVEIVEMPITSSIAHKKTTKSSKKSDDDNTDENKESDTGRMGALYFVKHGLYRVYISISPRKCKKYNVSQQDIELLEEALIKMYWDDASLVRPTGSVMVDKLVKIEHPDALSIPFTAVSATKEGDHYVYNIDEKLLKERNCKATVLV